MTVARGKGASSPPPSPPFRMEERESTTPRFIIVRGCAPRAATSSAAQSGATRGAHAPSHVPAGALAGRREATRMAAGTRRVFSARARKTTREGACAPHAPDKP